MPKQTQEKIVNYSKKQMFELISDINNYDKFLPWCKKSTVISKNIIEDDLIISRGSIVRVIREPYFGRLGKIINLPYELVKMKSETMVRVAEVEFDDKSKEIIPRANLEVILSN